MKIPDEENRSEFNDGYEIFETDEEPLDNEEEKTASAEETVNENSESVSQSVYQNVYQQQEVYQNPYNRDYTKNPNYRQYQYFNNTNTVNNANTVSGQIPYQNPVPYVVKRVFDRVDRIMAGLAILIGFFFVWFIFAQDFNLGIGATVCFETTLFLSYSYIAKKGLQIDLLHKVTFFILALLCIPFTFYSNRLALAMDFFVLVLGTLYWIYSTGGSQRKTLGDDITDLFISWFVYPFTNYGAMYPALFRKEGGKKSSNVKWVVLGLIIAIPVVGVISALLMHGDEMFKAMFSFIFDNFLSHILEYVMYAILGLPITMGFFSAWYTKYTEDKRKAEIPTVPSVNKKSRYFIPLALVYSVVIPVCVVYFLYMVSQVSYFISYIAKNLLPENFTIVDYARKGFFFFFIIAVINLIVIALMIGLSQRPKEKIAFGVRVITVMMSVFTMIFIGTAFYKMSMYIKTYGYTPMRINTSIFIIFVFIVFVTVILSLFFKQINLFKTTLVTLLLFLSVFNVIDVDAFVAKENIRMYREKRIGWMGDSLVRKLDTSAFIYLVPFAEEENNGLKQEEKRELHYAIDSRKSEMEYGTGYNDLTEHFPSFNVSRYNAYRVLMNYDSQKYEEKFRVYSGEHSHNFDYDNDDIGLYDFEDSL